MSIDDVLPLMPSLLALAAYFGLLLLIGVVLVIALIRIPPEQIVELMRTITPVFRRLADRLPGQRAFDNSTSAEAEALTAGDDGAADSHADDHLVEAAPPAVARPEESL